MEEEIKQVKISRLYPEEIVVILTDLRKHCCMMAREEEDADKELWMKRERALDVAIRNYRCMWDFALQLSEEFNLFKEDI